MSNWINFVDDPYAVDLMLEIKSKLNELVEQRELLDSDYDNNVVDEDYYESEKEYLDSGIKALQLELLELKKECE